MYWRGGYDDDVPAAAVAREQRLRPQPERRLIEAPASPAQMSLALWQPRVLEGSPSPGRQVVVRKAVREPPPYVGLEEIRAGGEAPTFELTEAEQIEQDVRVELAELRLRDLQRLAARYGLWSALAPEPAPYPKPVPSLIHGESVDAVAGALMTSLGLGDHEDTRCQRCQNETAAGIRGALARCSRCPPESRSRAIVEMPTPTAEGQMPPPELRERLTGLLLPVLVAEEQGRRRQAAHDSAHSGNIHSRNALLNPQPTERPRVRQQHKKRDGERCVWCENLLKTDRTSCLPESLVGGRIREERPNLPPPVSFYWMHNDCYLAAGAGQPRIVPRN